MKLRSLFAIVWALILAVGVLPAASVFADSQVPSWGDPTVNYGALFYSAEGNFTESGVAFGDFRPAQLDRWQVVFKDFQTGQVTNAVDKYDVFDLQKVLPSDNFETKNGYGLLPVSAADRLVTFIKMANGNPLFVVTLLANIAGDYTVPDETWQSVFYNVTQDLYDPTVNWYVRSAMLVAFSGGRLDHVENTPTNPFDPGQPNGIAYYAISPWPKINQAVVQGSTVHVDFTTYGLNPLHHPIIEITNGTDKITNDFGQVNKDGSHDTYNGTWDVPLDQVKKLGSLDKLTVIVMDGYGRTAQAPLKPGAVLTYHWGTNYHVSYTPGQPAVFTQPLVLTLDQMPSMIDPKTQSDTFQWSYSVDGGAWKPLNVLPDVAKVFDQNGNPKQKIVITTDTLNQIGLQPWGNSNTHTIQVKVTASPGDQGQYLFSSADSGTNQPAAVVTVTFDATHPLGQQAPGQAQFGPLVLKWGAGLPAQVGQCGTFTAPVEISNNGDEAKTTTLDFTIQGTIVVKRTFESIDGPPPPPQYMSYPLLGTIQKTFTVGPHSVVWWNVADGLSYAIQGYEGPTVGKGYHDDVLCGFITLPETTSQGPIGPLVGPLDVGMPAAISNAPEFQPNYAAYIKVTPEDPQDYISSYIDAWIGVKGPITQIGRPRVHLVQ